MRVILLSGSLVFLRGFVHVGRIQRGRTANSTGPAEGQLVPERCKRQVHGAVTGSSHIILNAHSGKNKPIPGLKVAEEAQGAFNAI